MGIKKNPGFYTGVPFVCPACPVDTRPPCKAAEKRYGRFLAGTGSRLPHNASIYQRPRPSFDDGKLVAGLRAFLHLAVFEGYWVSAKIIMSETLRFNTAAIFSIVSTLGTHLPDSIKYNWLLEIPVCATSLSCE